MPASYLAASDVMSSPVFAVGPSDTVSHAKNLMIRHRISRVLVIDGGRLAGVMTQKDIAYRLKQPEAAWKRRPPDRIPVREYMTGNPIVVSPEARLRSIAGTFVAKEISCVPVVDHTAVVGIVTKGDLMKSALVSDLKGTVGDVMEDAVTVSRWHSLAHVVTLMQERGWDPHRDQPCDPREEQKMAGGYRKTFNKRQERISRDRAGRGLSAGCPGDRR